MLEVGFFSDVINSRLGLVITPGGLRFSCSCLCRVYVDYYFYVGLGLCWAVWVLIDHHCYFVIIKFVRLVDASFVHALSMF